MVSGSVYDSLFFVSHAFYAALSCLMKTRQWSDFEKSLYIHYVICSKKPTGYRDTSRTWCLCRDSIFLKPGLYLCGAQGQEWVTPAFILNDFSVGLKSTDYNEVCDLKYNICCIFISIWVPMCHLKFLALNFNLCW